MPAPARRSVTAIGRARRPRRPASPPIRPPARLGSKCARAQVCPFIVDRSVRSGSSSASALYCCNVRLGAERLPPARTQVDLEIGFRLFTNDRPTRSPSSRSTFNSRKVDILRHRRRATSTWILGRIYKERERPPPLSGSALRALEDAREPVYLKARIHKVIGKAAHRKSYCRTAASTLRRDS